MSLVPFECSRCDAATTYSHSDAECRRNFRSQLAAVAAERDELKRRVESMIKKIADHLGEKAALACAVERMRGVLDEAVTALDQQGYRHLMGTDWIAEARAALSTPPAAEAEAIRVMMQHFHGHDKECGVVTTGDDCTCGRDAAYFAPTLAWARPVGRD